MPTAHYDRVKAFMQKVGQDTPEGAAVPDEKTRILRAKLILEEALETVEALADALLAYKGTVSTSRWLPGSSNTNML